MSRKSERLVNLTIALLHTKRPLTKNEIFSSVSGYRGSAESMERMFERDKDELRSAGVVIETRAIDSYFEDEIGYRINPSQYAIDLGELEYNDIALMAMAVEILNSENKDLLRRIRSLEFSIETEAPISTGLQLSPSIGVLVQAIDDRRQITFGYLDSEGKEQLRHVNPYYLYSLHGDWYFLGFDIDRQDLRNFKLVRFASMVTIKRDSKFELPQTENFAELIERRPLQRCELLLRKGAAHRLRSLSRSIEENGDWDCAVIEYYDGDWILEEVLWHLDDVIVQKPLELRDRVLTALKQVVALHE